MNLTLALPKGRPLEEAIQLFSRAGIDLHGIHGRSRKLIHEQAGLRVLIVRDADVPTFVEYGAADMGIAGLDILEEQQRELYMPLDLGIGRCRLCVAEPVEQPRRTSDSTPLRYATKFPNLTRRHLERTGVTGEVIKLYGSVELGALTGLADRIVDLVQSGETLRQNRLRELETILEVSSRLVCNRAAFKLKRTPMGELLGRLEAVVK